VAHTSERLVIEAIQVCLRAILGAATNSGLPFEKRLLLAAIFHCSTDVDHARAMRDLGDTVDSLKPDSFSSKQGWFAWDTRYVRNTRYPIPFWLRFGRDHTTTRLCGRCTHRDARIRVARAVTRLYRNFKYPILPRNRYLLAMTKGYRIRGSRLYLFSYVEAFHRHITMSLRF
jgi:hypothetical protein